MDQAGKYVAQITSALNYIHGVDVIHRDLKPENVIFASPNDLSKLKVVDFGFARV